MVMDYRAGLVDQLDPARKKQPEMLDTFDPSQRSDNTGISGGRDVLGADPVSAAPSEPTRDLATNLPSATAGAPSASDYSRLMGADAGKLNDPNKHDFKYDTLRTLSKFDPRQGFTPEVINALNSELGNTYGTFSSKGGDKLSLTGAKGAKDAVSASIRVLRCGSSSSSNAD